MENHLKTARLHRGLSWLYGAISILFAVMLATDRSDNWGIFLAVTCSFVALFWIHHALYRGARNAKNWARYGSIAIAILMLPALPIGSLIGTYLLINARQTWDETTNTTGYVV